MLGFRGSLNEAHRLGGYGEMTRLKIEEKLDLDVYDWGKVDLHSLINVANILKGELGRLARDTGDIVCRKGEEACANLVAAVERDSEISITSFSQEIEGVEKRIELLSMEQPAMMLRCEIIERILNGLNEFLADHQLDRLTWSKTRKGNVITKLHRFLRSTEKVSRNRFYVTFPPASAGKFTYLVEFNIHTDDEIIEIPPILNDLIRDLVANARKYSDPNTRIEIDLRFPEEGMLQLKVRDQGIGIPDDEIGEIVKYGYRASNVLNRPTMGKGIGLTKAYLMTQHFKGAFWIESTLGEGTLIELTLHRD